MPELSRFSNGTIIVMRWGQDEDNEDPHFHAKRSGKEAQIFIPALQTKTSDRKQAALEKKYLKEIYPWAEFYELNLLYAWHQCSSGETPTKIPPPPVLRSDNYVPLPVPDWFIDQITG